MSSDEFEESGSDRCTRSLAKTQIPAAVRDPSGPVTPVPSAGCITEVSQSFVPIAINSVSDKRIQEVRMYTRWMLIQLHTQDKPK